MADEDKKSPKQRDEGADPLSPPASSTDDLAAADDDRVGASPVIDAPEIEAGLDTGSKDAKLEAPATPVPPTSKDSPGKIAPETAPIMDLSGDDKTDKTAESDVQKPNGAPLDIDAEEPTGENKAGPQNLISDQEMMSRFNSKYMPLLNEIWGVPEVDTQLMEALGQSGSVRKSKFGLEFTLPNGHRLEWHQNLGGAEFIGMASRSDKFDMDDAHATIAASKSRGWNSINVHGSRDEKEMLWLEAQRQGLQVTNFIPTADSEVRRLWEQENQEELDKKAVGATPTEHGMPDLDAVKKFGDEPRGDDIADSAEPVKDAPAEDTPDEPEAASPPASNFMAPKPDVDTAGKPVPVEAELPAGSMTFQQFLEREAADGTNSPEMVRGYMEMQAMMVEDKIDPSDIDAIQLGRSVGMGGNTMRQKIDSVSPDHPANERVLSPAEFNDLSTGFEGLMRTKGGSPDFSLDRTPVAPTPSSPALDTSTLKEAPTPVNRKSAPVV